MKIYCEPRLSLVSNFPILPPKSLRHREQDPDQSPSTLLMVAFYNTHHALVFLLLHSSCCPERSFEHQERHMQYILVHQPIWQPQVRYKLQRSLRDTDETNDIWMSQPLPHYRLLAERLYAKNCLQGPQNKYANAKCKPFQRSYDFAESFTNV